jgi:hypothetical protein
MKTQKLFWTVLLALCLFTVSCTSKPEVDPKVTVSPERVLHHDHVSVHGTGFSPKKNVSSHLRRPNGTEYPVLPMLTDDRGEFMHDIDTLILGPGHFELWVIDDTSGKTSNIAQFDVTTEPIK